MNPKFKDVEISGRRYRVGLVSAMIGNWIVAQIQGGDYRKEDIFPSVQGHLLEACWRYQTVNGEADIPVKFFSRERGFLLPELADDLWTVNRLYDEAVNFNFTPFFDKLDALKAATQQNADALSATPQPNSPKA